MNTQKQLLMSVVFCVLLSVFSQISAAQDNGSKGTVQADTGSLPPGAVYENGVVSHPITSAEENLHLLAGYYYLNPREWKRIYKDNRNIISNPNQLPVGQTLRIQVGENWKPMFSYEEWFRLANRNGQWKSDQPWKPARASSGTIAAPPKPETVPVASSPVPEVLPVTEAPKENESPPIPVQPQPAPPKEAPKEEDPQPVQAEETPAPESTDDGDAAPAF